MISNRAGMEVATEDLGYSTTLILSSLFLIPPAIRERLIFADSHTSRFMQKMIVRLLGGRYLLETRFTDGLMAGDRFQCWTSEKYFMLGDRVERDAQEKLSEIIHRGQVVYDIGAYAGFMSLLFSRLVGAEGKVFAFEPSPTNLPRIRHNIEMNLRTNVSIIAAAVSDHEGAVAFCESGSMSAVVTADTQGSSSTTEIQTIILDDFVFRDGHPAPNFVKVDIEGYAGVALSGMNRVLAQTHPGILCELHNPGEEREFAAATAPHGYKIEPLDGGSEYPRRVMAIP